MMKALFIPAVFWIIAVVVQAQPAAYRDSLLKELQQEKRLEQRIELQAALARSYGFNDTSYQIANEILEVSQREGYLKGEAYARELRSNSLYNMDSLQASLVEDSLHLQIQQQLGDTLLIAGIYNTMGGTYFELKKTDLAIEYLLKAAQTFEQVEDYDWLAIIYNNLGELLMYNEQYDEASHYLRESLRLRKQYKEESTWHYTYTNLGHLYSSIGQLDSAIYYHEQTIRIAQRYELVEIEATGYHNIGNSYYEVEKYEQSIPYFLKAKPIFERLERRIYRAQNYGSLASAYLELKDYEQTIAFAKQALELTEEAGPLNLARTDSEILAVAYAGLGDYEKAYQYLRQQHRLDDSIAQGQNLEIIAELERKYRTQKQQAQIAEQQLKLKSQSRVRNYILLGACLAILILMILFQYFRNRQKVKSKQAELNLKLKQAEARQLRELDHLKSNFFANISHEFRTPLTLILGPIRKALNALPVQEVVPSAQEVRVPARELKVVERNALRLHNLVNQLLDLSKLDSGKMRLQVAPGDLLRFVRQVVFSFESLAERNKIHFETKFPDKLEDSWYDADKLEKILSNLLSNAFKFTPEGGKIAVELTLQGEQVNISIQDSGPGMTADEANRIFERFYQVEGTQDQGTGIGLSLVHELVKLYRGEILVDSEKGRGALFSVRLPYKQSGFTPEDLSHSLQKPHALSLTASDSIPLEEPLEEATTEDNGQPLVLIVEDNYDLRNFIADTLSESYRIILAEHGKKGLETAIAETPDLIISDVLMPEMNGFELSERLKNDQRTSHIPIILLTAKAGQAHKLKGLETGADDYLTKPFDQKELLLRARNLIARSEQLREKYAGKMNLQPSEIEVTSVDELFLSQVSQVIEEHLGDEQFSVESLAAAVAFSRSQLHRKLKALTGKSPNEHIRNFRLLRAKELLEKGAGNVSEISVTVGYSSLSYFTSSFKKAFGASPGEIVKKGNRP
jgi:signal transduction histidine kinase/DNA-binding response OmpR family regulator